MFSVMSSFQGPTFRDSSLFFCSLSLRVPGPKVRSVTVVPSSLSRVPREMPVLKPPSPRSRRVRGQGVSQDGRTSARRPGGRGEAEHVAQTSRGQPSGHTELRGARAPGDPSPIRSTREREGGKAGAPGTEVWGLRVILAGKMGENVLRRLGGEGPARQRRRGWCLRGRGRVSGRERVTVQCCPGSE